MAALDGDADRLLRLAAAIEAKSEHPLGKALVAHAEASGIPLPPAQGVRALYGQGLTASSRGKLSRSAMSGWRRALAKRRGYRYGTQKLGTGGTLAFVLIGGRLAGGVRFADEARPEARAAIADLHGRGLRTVMLTGDNETAAKAVGDAVGIDDIRARLQPEEKVAALKALADDGIAFVGDGVNDGPALATARLASRFRPARMSRGRPPPSP